MNFANASQRLAYDRISAWLPELFGDRVIPRRDVPAFVVAVGSALVQTGVHPWGEDDATITSRAYVVRGARPDPELLKFLLRRNADMRFGAFGIDDEGNVIFEHTIVGSTCDRVELAASVVAVARVADDYDDRIVARWGGRRALEEPIPEPR